MKLISHHIHGRFQNSTLTLINATPTEETAVSLHLLFPFITRGDEIHIFPASVLDDWGTEIRGLQLYEWIRENGEQFPRAELFGVDKNGRSTQEFLRSLEIYFRFPCYLHSTDSLLHTGSTPIKTIILPANTDRKNLPYPLRRASVVWKLTETN